MWRAGLGGMKMNVISKLQMDYGLLMDCRIPCKHWLSPTVHPVHLFLKLFIVLDEWTDCPQPGAEEAQKKFSKYPQWTGLHGLKDNYDQ